LKTPLTLDIQGNSLDDGPGIHCPSNAIRPVGSTRSVDHIPAGAGTGKHDFQNQFLKKWEPLPILTERNRVES
jgi:hypothetical protein